MLSMSNDKMLIHAFMTSRLDYCNALLGGCSAHLINRLHMVQNAAAWVLTRTSKYDHISPVLSTLHWLPIKNHIDFKILLILFKALNGLAPQYLSELLSHYSPPRLLRSQNSGHLIKPRKSKSTAGGKSFFYLAPKLWNCNGSTEGERSENPSAVYLQGDPNKDRLDTDLTRDRLGKVRTD